MSDFFPLSIEVLTNASAKYRQTFAESSPQAKGRNVLIRQQSSASSSNLLLQSAVPIHDVSPGHRHVRSLTDNSVFNM